MATKIRGATALTGGGAGAIDAISGAVLADGDIVVAVYDGQVYTYVVDADSGLAESSPHIVAPDVSAGDKRLILQSMSDEIDVLAIYGDGVNRTRTAIEAAKTALGTVNKYTLLIRRGTWTIDDDLTITSNLTLKVIPGALLQIASGKTLTIGGPFEAGLYQVFSCADATALVVFGDGSAKGIRPEWWGALADDLDASATLNTTAINYAAVSAGVKNSASDTQTLLLSEGTYKVTATASNYALTFWGSVKGVSTRASRIENIGAGSAVKVKGAADGTKPFYFQRLQDFSVVGNASSQDGIVLNPDAVANSAASYSVFDNVDSYSHGRDGLVIEYAWGTRFNNCKFHDNLGLGVFLADGVTTSHNNIIFINCESRWNGGTGNNGADFTKGGVRISGISRGVYWIGGVVESNNAWGFIIGLEGTAFPQKVVIDNVYFEGNPASTGTSTIGGNVYASSRYNEISVHDCFGYYGAEAGATGYAFYINRSSTEGTSYFQESGNVLLTSGAGTAIRDYGINYNDKWRAETELITATNDRTFAGAGNWTNNNFDTFTVGAGVLTISASATQSAYLPKANINNGAGLVMGKRYGLKYTATGVTGLIQFASAAKTVKTQDIVNGQGNIVEFVWSEDNANQALWINSIGAATAVLDNLSLVEIDGGVSPANILSGLLSITTVSLTADGDTTLYTVPTGKRCVLTHAVLVADADAGATSTISIGANGTETDFIPANTLSNLDAQYDSVILMPIPNTTPLKGKSYAAGTVIQAQVANQSGTSASNTLYLYGMVY